MNIGIVTWLGTGNLGTSLQSYALHEFLKLRGYNVYLLKEFSEDDFLLKNKIKRYISKKKMFIKTIINKTNIKRIYDFNKENYNLKEITNRRIKREIINQTDVFVTGSDQIWNCYNSFSPFMFLSFAENKKRIAYASSMGTKDFPSFCTNKVRELLSCFQHIGVREKSIVKYLNDFLERNDVIQVLDPTFLLNANQWINFCNKANINLTISHNQYIFCYFIGKNLIYEEQLNEIRKLTGINNIILIPSLEYQNINFKHCTIYKKAGPYEFVKLLKDSSLVCTDSFHACALSINLSKEFIVFKRFKDNDPKSQNNRIYDMLSTYNLENKIYDKNFILSKTNYEPIQAKLNIDRNNSINYLISSIDK